MSGHNAEHYTADGDSNVGFRTGGKFVHGAELTGFKIGVRGEGGLVAGVVGRLFDGNGVGVLGINSRAKAGVLGLSSAEDAPASAQTPYVGVEGRSDGENGIGVIGRSVAELSVHDETHGDTGGKAGGGTGVLGTSGWGFGVEGRSDQGAGVVGFSRDHRGGQFMSSGAAQVWLVPQQRDRPPKQGYRGDLLAITHVDSERAELWFCIGDQILPDTPASWARIAFDAFYP